MNPTQLAIARICLPAIVLALGGLSMDGRATAADPAKAAADLRTEFAADIEALAKWCESNGLAGEASRTRRTLVPQDPYKLYVPVLPNEVGTPPPPDAPANVVEWNNRLGRLRRDYATSLFEMARRAVRGGRAAMAFEMALVALHTDPDYEPARRLFGYQKFHEHWCTAYEIKRLRGGFVWSDKFGWISKSFLRRYEEGQRYTNGRWISAAEDAEQHRNIREGWEIETEHYAIRTNHSIASGVALGVKLERLEHLWQQIFMRYGNSEADVLAMFEGRGKPSAGLSRRHRVVYFHNRDDYDAALRAVMPNVEITVGVYRDTPPCAYFFAGEESDDRTLYHEATHQLFHESRPIASEVGQQANFWIIEGIAMYMESLREEDGYYVLGGFDDERLHAAAYRLLHDNFYVPLVQFTGYGMERFQTDPRVATFYSQAAGQANFLVYYDQGRYRDALVSYLVAVYTGHDDANTLPNLTGATFSTLDKQYREFIEAGAKQGESLETSAKSEGNAKP